MTQHNKSGADEIGGAKCEPVCVCGGCEHFNSHDPWNRTPAPIADAGVKRPERDGEALDIYLWWLDHMTEYSFCNITLYDKRAIGAVLCDYRIAKSENTSLESQLAQARGKNVELAERVKELEILVSGLHDLVLSYKKLAEPGIMANKQIIATANELQEALSSAASGKDGE